MNIKLGGAVLRQWRVGDEQSLMENANNKTVWENLSDDFPHPYTARDAKRWVKLASSEKPIANFAIEIDNCAVGGIGLSLKQGIHQNTAEIGYWLGQPFWYQGIATKAVRAVTEYAFSNFEIHRLFACVFDWNFASKRVLEKVGFELEARLKNNIIKKGRTGDELIYAIFESPKT